MSKTSDLLLTLDELITCGQNMVKAANDLKAYFSSTEESDAPAAVTEKPIIENTEPTVSAYAFADVRKAFSAKSHEGYTEEVKALITKYGAAKLSSIKEENYSALMADLEVIGCHSTQD